MRVSASGSNRGPFRPGEAIAESPRPASIPAIGSSIVVLMMSVRSQVAIWTTVVFATVGLAEAPRQVPLDGQANFRDIGGYMTSDGRTMKRGLVYRSGRLPRLTDDDVAKLEQLGIRTVVNFLTAEEIEASGENRLPRDAREILLPIETDDGLVGAVLEARKRGDFSKVPADLNPEIHRILVDEARIQYASLFKVIAHSDAPIVFHCSHGIHRTGTAAAILLWGLGVPWETIREDYLLSNAYRKSEVEHRLAQLRELAARNQNVSPDNVDMTNINAFYILEGRYIDAARDEILSEYGSVAHYLADGLGLSDSEIETLRRRLLE